MEYNIKRKISSLQQEVWAYYRTHRREMPWRKTKSTMKVTAYHILVSEVMLQQTQVPRIMGKFPAFIAQFPTLEALACASVAEVITAWQGLGYNRRALSLQKTAKIIVEEYEGVVPDDPEVLVTFPGIGPATAASIAVYAYNKPYWFIETNVRSVFLHHFFPKDGEVHDKELEPLIVAALDRERPREWHWALMDYGTMIKERYPNPNRKSRHYTKQSKFETSDRYIRGGILKKLTTEGEGTLASFATALDRPADRVKKCLAQLHDEGFITKVGERYTLV